MQKETIILGIDPGTSITGYGLISAKGQEIKLMTLGVIHLSRYETHALKLKKIFERVIGIIDEFHPDFLAIEEPFYGKNIQSMLKLGRAQGVAMAAALYRDIPIVEYSARKVKQAITGKGNSSKEQVAFMLQRILNFTESPEFLDATDGLAVAVCHHMQKGAVLQKKGASGWKTFVSNNPGKIIKG